MIFLEQFDLFVIGGGPGGYEAALEAAALGKSVAIADETAYGGVCLNRGCIPTKALLRASGLYREALSGQELGVRAESISWDLSAMHQRVAQVQTQLREGIAFLLDKGKVRQFFQRARVLQPGQVTVAGETFAAENILVSTGSRPAPLPIPGGDLPGVVSSDILLTDGGQDCQHLIIIGGGVIGVEFATIYRALGRDVTVLEALPRLLDKLDREIGQNLTMILKKQGVVVETGVQVQAIAREGSELLCTVQGKSGEKTFRGDCVLVCTGRKPNTEDLFSPEIAERLSLERGYVPTDDCGRTQVPGLWAAGDIVAGGIQLAHAATAQGKQAVHAMFSGVSAPIGPIPACVFTHPEIATVGLSADEAKKAGIPVTVQKSLTSMNGRALVEGSERGFAKLVFHKETGVLLGAQLMCPHAGEMIGGLTLAIRAGLTHDQMAGTVYPHPTVSELLSF